MDGMWHRIVVITVCDSSVSNVFIQFFSRSVLIKCLKHLVAYQCLHVFSSDAFVRVYIICFLLVMHWTMVAHC